MTIDPRIAAALEAFPPDEANDGAIDEYIDSVIDAEDDDAEQQ